MRNNFLPDGMGAAILSFTRRAGRTAHIAHAPYPALNALATLPLR